MFASGRRIYTTLLRERRRVKSSLYVLTIIVCCLVVWDPSILDPLILMFLSQNGRAPATNYPPSRPSIPTVAPPGLLRIFDLPFIPKNHKCEELFEKSGFNFSYSLDFWVHSDAYKSFLMEVGMIQDASANEQTWVYHELAKHPTIKTICDVGFNTGHNAFHCLASRFDVILHSFEDRVTNLTRDMEIFMSSEFPFQFFSHFGNFKLEIPRFFSENNTTKCDLILLDSTLSSSKMQYLMETFNKVANPEQNIVILDAHPDRSKRESLKTWEVARHQGLVVENFRCSFTSDEDDSLRRPNVTGFLLGHFIAKK